MIQGFAIIFLLLLTSELLVRGLSLPFPSSVIGLLLLLLCLQIGVVKIEWVKSVSDILLKHLSLFFVPPALGSCFMLMHFNRALWRLCLRG